MKLLSKTTIFIIFLAILGGILFYSSEILFAPSSSEISKNKACFNSTCFFVKLAKTEAEREEGLMSRNKLDEDKGMLFIFDKEEIYPFWMKNTLIPLDMIWLDNDKKIVFIAENVQPCSPKLKDACPSIIPKSKAKYVLEINAGMFKKTGAMVGNVANFELLNN